MFTFSFFSACTAQMLEFTPLGTFTSPQLHEVCLSKYATFAGRHDYPLICLAGNQYKPALFKFANI